MVEKEKNLSSGEERISWSQDVKMIARRAQRKAISLKHESARPEHLLDELVHSSEVKRILTQIGVDAKTISKRFKEYILSDPSRYNGPGMREEQELSLMEKNAEDFAKYNGRQEVSQYDLLKSIISSGKNKAIHYMLDLKEFNKDKLFHQIDVIEGVVRRNGRVERIKDSVLKAQRSIRRQLK